MRIFAKLFDVSNEWKNARLPIVHARVLIDALACFARQETNIGSYSETLFGSEMWHETNSQKDKTIIPEVGFPESDFEMIFSGPHIGISNPLFKTAKRICVNNSDYDVIDLHRVPAKYFQRRKYSVGVDITEYIHRAPENSWGTKNLEFYRVFMRNMFNQSGERTLISALAPPRVGHVHAVYEIGFTETKKTVLAQSIMSSLPLDFFVKSMGKGSGGIGVVRQFPIFDSILNNRLILNSLLLNCLTLPYSNLWKECWDPMFLEQEWSKIDHRLNNEHFTELCSEWAWSTPLRSDYMRRHALVEIDVLTAMALGMTLDQLKIIYHIQFPVLQSYEADTWYDANGRIVFTNNRSLTGVGFSRSEWENGIKGASAGQKFYRTITDNTMPGEPIKRMIEYVAPFDRCDRIKDYEIAWSYFADKYESK